MKALIHVTSQPHQWSHGVAMKTGLERHGLDVAFAGYDEPAPCDFAVAWGWRQKAVIATAPHVLVMEAGHIQGSGLRRLSFISCGWDGLARRGTYATICDAGRRWQRLYLELLQPWREAGEYVLLIGQIPGDESLRYLQMGFPAWAEMQTDALLGAGKRVVYRPHPGVATPGSPAWAPVGAELATGTLQEDLAGARQCVAFNSGAATEAVLAGVPTATFDEGAMAWPVTGHALHERVTPDRTTWAHQLAWTSYSLEELASGFAWEILRDWMPARESVCS